MSVQAQLGFADVVERFAGPTRQHLSLQGHQVLNQIQACRTSVLGGQLLKCNQCQQHRMQYHSCRNRHCPRCGYQASQQWVADRMQDIMPVTYHHVVFTLPHELNAWVGKHRQTIYGLLFQSVWTTLKKFGSDRRRLNGELGATLVLHTWGQSLTRHVHMHCLVPGGALQASGEWKEAGSTYLFPVRALSRHYRGKMVSLLRESRDVFMSVEDQEFDKVLNALMNTEWVVYSKPVISKTQTVVEYLARYTKRIGLTNARLLKMNDKHVWISYRDYRGDGHRQVMKLEGEELVRRFMLHLLPKRFMRVRYFGYLANVHRRCKLKKIRQALHVKKKEKRESSPVRYHPICDDCQSPMIIVRELPPKGQQKLTGAELKLGWVGGAGLNDARCRTRRASYCPILAIATF